MSPLRHLFGIAALYLLAAAVLALPAAAIWLCGGLAAYDHTAFVFLCLIAGLFVGLAAFCLLSALTGAVQAALLFRFHCREKELLDSLKADLDSAGSWKRRRALQALAGRYGQPFGLILCWPIQYHGAGQFENMVLLYKEWLEIREAFGRDGTITAHIILRLHTPARLVVRSRIGGGRLGWIRRLGSKWQFPWVPKKQLVAALRGRVEQALRDMADVINDSAPGEVVAMEAGLFDILAHLLWDAVDTALTIGMNAAACEKPAGGGNHGEPTLRKVEEALDRANDAVKDAILDLGIEDEGPAPYPECRPLPPVAPDRLAAALRVHIDRTVAAVVARVNAARDLEGIASADEEIRRHFETLACTTLELAAGLRVDAAAERLPWSAAPGEWARRLRRMAALDSVVESSPGEGKAAGA